ncbi:hypothetical protein RMATCC62417_05637 [Rhizopus microsporus]|nr:hypothetical protein RMATCC62417_05637 [Rhizopus microsporus]
MSLGVEESMLLYNRIKNSLRNTKQSSNINMEKPIASFLSLPDREDLYEFRSLQGPFSDLLEINPVGFIPVEQSVSSIVQVNTPFSIDLQDIQSFNPEFIGLDPMHLNGQESFYQQTMAEEHQQTFILDDVDFDLGINDYNFPSSPVDSYQMLLNVDNIPSSRPPPSNSLHSSSNSSDSTRHSGSGDLVYAPRHHPSLILEEDEVRSQMSVSTEMLDVLVTDSELVTAESMKRNRRKRTMIDSVGATIMPILDYAHTERIVVQTHQAKVQKRQRVNELRSLMRTPAAAWLSPEQLFSYRRIRRESSATVYTRMIERSRYARRSSSTPRSYPPSVTGGSTVRSASDLTTPELQLYEFRENDVARAPNNDTFSHPMLFEQFEMDYDQDDILLDHFEAIDLNRDSNQEEFFIE